MRTKLVEDGLETYDLRDKPRLWDFVSIAVKRNLSRKINRECAGGCYRKIYRKDWYIQLRVVRRESKKINHLNLCIMCLARPFLADNNVSFKDKYFNDEKYEKGYIEKISEKLDGIESHLRDIDVHAINIKQLQQTWVNEIVRILKNTKK